MINRCRLGHVIYVFNPRRNRSFIFLEPPAYYFSCKLTIRRGKKVETMESETRRIFEVIRDSHLPFATWEIKSPFASPREVMLAVPDLGDFSWTSCTHPDGSTDKKHIRKRRKTADIKERDALAPPWNLKVSLFPYKALGCCSLQLQLQEALSDTSIEPLSAPSAEGSSRKPQRPVNTCGRGIF